MRLDRIDLYLKITENFNKSKAQYQKMAYTPSSLVSSLSPQNLSTSFIPKEMQPQLNLQKAKKAIFFDEFDQRQPKTSAKLFTSNMINSMVGNYENYQFEQIEEEKAVNPMMVNSKYVNNPIKEESSSENSEREYEHDAFSLMPSYLNFDERKRSVSQPLFTFGESLVEKKPQEQNTNKKVEERGQINHIMVKSDESEQKHNGDKRQSLKKGVYDQLRRLQELEKRLDKVLSAEKA